VHPRLLQYYNQELRYLRDLGQEFAEAHPKVAGQLGLGAAAQDPYIERLLEGSAFLAARVQLKLDAEFPRLSHRLLDMVYPGFNAPLPAMLVARMQPAPDPQLLAGHRLPRGTALHGAAPALTGMRCEFRTAQDTVLTPVSVAEARLVREHAALNALGGLPAERPRAALVLSLRLPDGQRFDQLGFDRLRFFLTGAPDVAASLVELTLSRCVAVLAGASGHVQRLPASRVAPVGYADDEALLPAPPRGFGGLRILQETLAFPERFQFFDVDALSTAFTSTAGSAMELVLALTQADDAPMGAVSAANVLTNCVPAINLFPCRADRLLPGPDRHEFHVVVDRSRPLDHEVYEVTGMTAHDADGGSRRFEPLHGTARSGSGPVRRVYSVRREPRRPSERVRREGARSSYAGTEIFLSWSDGWEAEAGSELHGDGTALPSQSSLSSVAAAPTGSGVSGVTAVSVQPLPDQVALDVLCTNRDLPLFLRGGNAPLTLDAGIALTDVRAVAGPSRPLPPPPESSAAWRLLNLLSLNYLSLIDAGAGALRELLSQLPQAGDADVSRQIAALTGLSATVVHRRHPAPGPIAYARGVQIAITLDEQRLGAGSGHSAYLLGAALHHFLSRHVSLNSFIETVLVSTTRGEIGRWAPHAGARALL
jgi:type VI secretion system protein ImpG